MTWWQLSVQSTADELEQTEASLLAIGAVCITLCDAQDSPIYEPLPGDSPVWQHAVVTGMFEPTRQLEDLYDELIKLLPEHQVATASQSILEDQDWERVHLKHFKPIQCAHNLWVVPGWLSPPDPSATNIQLDPGLAFGTGSHPTTRLCLEWMAYQDFNHQSVIDYGCGSGILAIAACKLGAASVFAVDIDQQALSASTENALRNDIEMDMLHISLVTQMENVAVDLLIANILSGPLIELAPRFADLVKPEGRIMLSGILKHQVNDVKSAYQPFFNLDAVKESEDWVRITGSRNPELNSDLC
jgi:ribosomal protein L11 methyltransferase